MKKNNFERLIKRHGYTLLRNSKHNLWSNGTKTIAVPHNKKMNNMIAKRLLKEIAYPDNVGEVNYFA